MSIIVANWSDKQLDELLDLLKSSDFSPLAAFIFENFLASGNRIMTDAIGSNLRLSVNATDGRAVDLSPGVLQVNGLVSHVPSAQTINILATAVGPWGLGQAAFAGGWRWSLICIKNAWRRISPDNRWFVDDSIEPNVFSQQMTNTEREMSYFDIQVVHGTINQPIEDITVPGGYWCIGEIKVEADPTFALPVDPAKIFDTGLLSQDPTPHWLPTTRVLRLEFWSTLFGIDHETSGANAGHHKAGAWYIGGTAVTVTGNQINQALSAITAPGGPVTGANLTSLTNGAVIPPTLHSHQAGAELRSDNGYTQLPGGMYIMWGYGVWGSGETAQTVTFPIAFPNACLGVFVTTEEQTAGNAADAWFQLVSGSITLTNFVCFRQLSAAAATAINTRPRYIAIGY